MDGIVPRNAYGNVELFLPTMLPKGTKHLPIAGNNVRYYHFYLHIPTTSCYSSKGLNKIARKLGIDCAPGKMLYILLRERMRENNIC